MTEAIPLCACCDLAPEAETCTACRRWRTAWGDVERRIAACVAEREAILAEHARAHEIRDRWRVEHRRGGWEALFAEVDRELWPYEPSWAEREIARKHPALEWLVWRPAAEREWYAAPDRLPYLIERYPDVEDSTWITLLRRVPAPRP